MPDSPPGDAAKVPAANRRAGLEINPETCASLSAGERFDLSLTIEGMLSLMGPGPP